MENGRVVDLLSAMLVGMKGVNQRPDRLEHRFENLEGRIEKLEEQQAKANLMLVEMRTSFMRLADRLIRQDKIPERITKPEGVVFR